MMLDPTVLLLLHVPLGGSNFWVLWSWTLQGGVTFWGVLPLGRVLLLGGDTIFIGKCSKWRWNGGFPFLFPVSLFLQFKGIIPSLRRFQHVQCVLRQHALGRALRAADCCTLLGLTQLGSGMSGANTPL